MSTDGDDRKVRGLVVVIETDRAAQAILSHCGFRLVEASDSRRTEDRPSEEATGVEKAASVYV
jgi:hypothetical protein